MANKLGLVGLNIIFSFLVLSQVKAVSLEKTKMLGKIEGSRKRGNTRLIDSIKEPIGIGSRAVENRALWTSLIYRVAGSRS